MRVDELMSGDWVIRKGIPSEHMQIAGFNEFKNLVYMDFQGRGITENLDGIEPIPLTEEILKENGFHLWPGYSNVWTANTGGTRFCISNEYKIGHDDIGLFIMVTYVHELQHELKSCGIEKEIKL